MGVVLAELQGGGVLWQRGHVHLEKIDGKLSVNVMQLVLVPIFLRCSLWNLFQIVLVIRAFRIDTLVNHKAGTVFFADKRMPAIRALQLQRSCPVTGNKQLAADFAQTFSSATVVVVDVICGRMTTQKDDVFPNPTCFPSFDGLLLFPVFPLVIFLQKLPVNLFVPFDDRQSVYLELLIFRRLWNRRVSSASAVCTGR